MSFATDRWCELKRNSSGVSALEFALILPLFITLGMYGAEIAW